MDVLLLRFSAPLMSFGSSATVDRVLRTSAFPTLSMLTGLLGNALGYKHTDFDRLESLQSSLHFASRRDFGGRVVADYQTIDLGQEFMLDEAAWTTWGELQKRAGGSDNRVGTHQRWKDYLHSSCFTLAVSLRGPTVETMASIRDALKSPARPLFLGRKCCLPDRPLFLAAESASSLRGAVLNAPLPHLPSGLSKVPGLGRCVWWPEGDSLPGEEARKIRLVDCRDWRNQILVGSRTVYEEALHDA